jgi:uncharacterized protein YecE (DUF72 family)
MKKDIRIGCQGWNYADWVSKTVGPGVFYPVGTKPSDMLGVYSLGFDTVEVDSTFYAIPTESAVEGWYRKTPDSFTFALKLPREVTHERALHSESFPILAAFCDRARILKEKLFAVLVQLPPSFEANRENAKRLRVFLASLPDDIHFSVEFRHRDWMVDWTFDELDSRGASLCLVEGGWIPREKMLERVTSAEGKRVYVRFMGERDIERFDRVHRPMDGNLAVWADELLKLKSAETGVYFSNFYEGLATASANKFKRLMGQEAIGADDLESQGKLF